MGAAHRSSPAMLLPFAGAGATAQHGGLSECPAGLCRVDGCRTLQAPAPDTQLRGGETCGLLHLTLAAACSLVAGLVLMTILNWRFLKAELSQPCKPHAPVNDSHDSLSKPLDAL